jgi:hypothetical protein
MALTSTEAPRYSNEGRRRNSTELEMSRNRAISELLKSRENPRAMTVEEVQQLDKIFRFGEGRKQIFNKPIEDLVKEDYLFTLDMYRTTTFGPMAEESAKTLKRLCEVFIGPKKSNEPYRGIEGCTGAGSQTYALAKVGGLWITTTVEKDLTVAMFTMENLEKTDVKGLVNVMSQSNIIDVLQTQRIVNNGKGPQHDWVMVDPDWLGKHYTEEGDFSFQNMDPSGDDLVKAGLRVAKIVGIKAPNNLPDSEVFRLAMETDTHVYIRDMSLPVGNTTVDERMIYYIDRSLTPGSDQLILKEAVELNVNESDFE